MKTSLWSIKREKWIQGPDLHHSNSIEAIQFNAIQEAVCLIGVGNGEVYIMIGNELNVGYNLHENQWKKGTIPYNQFNYASMHHHSCTFHQNKEYKR